MQINIRHVAKLARLQFDDSQVEKLEKQMQDILGMVENLPELADGKIGVDQNNPMILRQDEIKPSLRRDDILKNAPKTEAGCIVVPKTVE